VYVSSSRLPQGGEGLFARRDIRQREVIALYNGIKVCTVGMPYGLYESSRLPQGGEGLFARRDIRQREVIALYNGIKVCTVGMSHGLWIV
jgi:hypothetical protein